MGGEGRDGKTPATLCMAVIKPQTSLLQVKPLLAVWRAGEEMKDKDVSVLQSRISDNLGRSGTTWA